MRTEEVERWLADTGRRLRERGTRVESVQRDTTGMDPDVVLILESSSVMATIRLWSSLQGAELHAVSLESGEELWLDRVKVGGHNFHEEFSPILSLF